MNQYEAMFLFDPTFGSSFEDCETEIRRLLERANGEVLMCRKWDERRLAYRVKGRKRGVYVLVYFKAPPDMITPLERDAKLAENVLRLLVLRAEGLTTDDMEAAFTKKREDSERADERFDRDGRPNRSDRPDHRKRTEERAPAAAEAGSAEKTAAVKVDTPETVDVKAPEAPAAGD